MPSLDSVALARVRDAALSCTPISLGVRRTASPHEFYRYPARFSPELAAAAIDAFSSPGDVVADYFVGGGTTLVEARRASRLAVGSDINSLSVFVSGVKTRLYSASELDQVVAWAKRVVDDEPASDEAPVDDVARSYFRNLMSVDTVEHRGMALNAIARLDEVDSPKARAFARCVLLRTAQWAFDMRRDIPPVDLLHKALVDNASMMTTAAHASTRLYRAADKRVRSFWATSLSRTAQGTPGGRRSPQRLALSRTPTSADLTPLSRCLRELPSLEGSWAPRDSVPVLSCRSRGWQRFGLLHDVRPERPVPPDVLLQTGSRFHRYRADV